MILAFDRSDIPAVTQRRNLAHQQPAEDGRQPSAAGRCEIPQWFETLRAGLRRDLHDAMQALTASEARRARLAAEATAAQRHLVRTEAATSPARQELATATDLHEEAWRRHACAQHDLDHSAIRGRRAARRDHDTAAGQLDEATEHLERVRRRTAANVDQYRQARRRADDTARRSIATACAGSPTTPATTSLPCADTSTRSTYGADGLAATPSTSSDSVTSSNNSPASAAGTNTPTGSKRSAKRSRLGRRRRHRLPAATRHSRTLQRAGPEFGL